ncbi:MAG: hypothetical protein EOO05_13255 [Chitinophagaceae bacterium]|nr:MAG: hypothetical protein EOO05_13255 [Chitinophagaceae bacterium]
MNSINFNGKFVDATQPVLLADNKGYRYGDGLFETIKVYKGTIQLEDLHFDRLHTSLRLLGMKLPSLLTREKICSSIVALCKKNKAEKIGRVRLSFFRGNGGLLEGGDEVQYLIEAWPLEPSVHEWNINGLQLGIYETARKNTDGFSGVKTASFLPYIMAARNAKANKWNDAIVLNTAGRVCDTSIANIFLVKNGRLSTPSLAEGCIDGVMRRYIQPLVKDHGLILEEKEVTVDELMEADEVFLTNAIRGIRWVERIGEKKYTHQLGFSLHSAVISSLFPS